MREYDVHMCVNLYVLDVWACACLCVCVCVCVLACVCMCVYVCVYVSVCIHIYTYILIYIRTIHIYKSTYLNVRTDICIYTQMYMHIQINTHAYKHKFTYTYVCLSGLLQATLTTHSYTRKQSRTRIIKYRPDCAKVHGPSASETCNIYFDTWQKSNT